MDCLALLLCYDHITVRIKVCYFVFIIVIMTVHGTMQFLKNKLRTQMHGSITYHSSPMLMGIVFQLHTCVG